MKIFRNFNGTGIIKNPVVTTGSFDGVHIGHKTILNRLSNLADKHNGESVLITFDPHPRKVLYPETAGRELKLINSQEEKLFLLDKAGLDNVIIIEFTRAFSQVTSEQFVREFLHGILNARVIVAGFNHHFGFNKEGDYRHLWTWQTKYNFEAEEIPEQEVQHETVSSTKIRDAIKSGYIQRANAYLDHYYMIMGKTIDYLPPYPEKVLPLVKIEITEECKLLPANGIYAVTVKNPGFSSKAMAVVHSSHEGVSEVLVNCLDEHSFPQSETSMVSFHKKISGPVDIGDKSSLYRISQSRDEIADLIY